MKTKLKEIVQPIVKWYQAQEKTLPWKQDKDPYHVWISEIMLQQTRIEAVKKYYIRFMEQLPTIQDVANTSEEQLLKLWEGLGYYSRVRNIKKAAIQIMQENQGKMPTNYKELLKMPGIGDYTAGAIASISYGEKVPAVDGNVLRVISRILASKEKYCIAYKENLTTEIPVRIKKQKRKIEKRTIFILEYKNKIAINKRPKMGILANLYEFPNVLGEVTEQEMEKQYPLPTAFKKLHEKSNDS